MQKQIAEIEEALKIVQKAFSALPDDFLTIKASPEKWSKKEILGHLIDSASTNIRRFICSQYEILPKIVYQQDFWVSANGYQRMDREEVLTLWVLVNQRLVHLMRSLPPDRYSLSCDTGNKEPEIRTLLELAQGYVNHMRHHLSQIFPDIYEDK